MVFALHFLFDFCTVWALLEIFCGSFFVSRKSVPPAVLCSSPLYFIFFLGGSAGAGVLSPARSRRWRRVSPSVSHSPSSRLASPPSLRLVVFLFLFFFCFLFLSVFLFLSFSLSLSLYFSLHSLLASRQSSDLLTRARIQYLGHLKGDLRRPPQLEPQGGPLQLETFPLCSHPSSFCSIVGCRPGVYNVGFLGCP